MLDPARVNLVSDHFSHARQVFRLKDYGSTEASVLSGSEVESRLIWNEFQGFFEGETESSECTVCHGATDPGDQLRSQDDRFHQHRSCRG